jgi:hyperosmotically inducible periplasmic protein
MHGAVQSTCCLSRVVTACTAGLVVCAIVSGCSAAVDRVAIEDAQTAARVKTALVNDAELGASAIEVLVEYGVVQLAGRVRTQTDADRAAAVARSVPGVQGVALALQVGGEAPTILPDARARSRAAPTDNVPEIVPTDNVPDIEGDPDLLAVGVSVGLSHPRSPALEPRVAISPVIKLGSGEGLGVAVGFDWFQAEVQLAPSGTAAMTRIHVKPIMVGLSYTLDSNRVSLAPSIVAGYAFNSLSVTDRGAVATLPVEVDNSLAWRFGASAWFDVSRRFALNVSGGYLMTRLRLTVLEDSSLVKHNQRGDTAIAHVGLAYRLF